LGSTKESVKGVATTEKLLIPASFGPVAQHHKKHPHSFAEAPPRQLHRLYRSIASIASIGKAKTTCTECWCTRITDMHANSRRMNA
jgi:hypothetical protein